MFRNSLPIALALTVVLAVLDAQTPPARRVAITIDDGPVVNEMTDLGNFQRITNGLVGSFQVEKVPGGEVPHGQDILQFAALLRSPTDGPASCCIAKRK